LREWLRDCAICVLLDLLSWVVPRDQRFEVIIEPDDDRETMVAVLREAPTLRTSEQTVATFRSRLL
jgi:hypothetical protein